MTIEQGVLILVSLVVALIGFLGTRLFNMVDAMENDVSKLSKEIGDLEIRFSREYVLHDRLSERLGEILAPFKESLARIEESLRHKMDKDDHNG